MKSNRGYVESESHLELVQKIRDLHEGSLAIGQQINITVSTVLASAIYLLLDRQFDPNSSVNIYNYYLQEKARANIDVSHLNMFTMINNDDYIKHEISRIPTKEIFKKFLNEVAKITRKEYRKAYQLTHESIYQVDENENIFERLQADTSDYSVRLKELVLSKLKNALLSYMLMASYDFSQEEKDHFSTYVKQQIETLSDDLKLYPLYFKFLSASADNMKYLKSFDSRLATGFSSTENEIARNIQSIRLIPELIASLAVFGISTWSLNRHYPQGVFIPHVNIKEEMLAKSSERELIKKAKEMEGKLSSISKRWRIFRSLMMAIVSALGAYNLLSGEASAFTLLINIGMGITVFLPWIYTDSLTINTKKQQEEIKKIRMLLTLMSNDNIFKFRILKNIHSYTVSCIITFDDIYIKDKKFSAKELLSFFKYLFTQLNINIDSNDSKKIAIRLPINTYFRLKPLEKVNRSMIAKFLDQEGSITNLKKQLDSVGEGSIVKHVLKDKVELREHVKIERFLTITFHVKGIYQDRILSLFPGAFLVLKKDAELSFNYSLELTADKLKELQSTINDCLLAKNNLVSSRVMMKNYTPPIKKGEKIKTRAVQSTSLAVSSNANNVQVDKVKWEKYGLPDDRIAQIENGLGKSYTCRLFEASDFESEEMGKAFCRVISDHPRIARAKGEDGLKFIKNNEHTDLYDAKKPDGTREPSEYKAKVVGIFGQWRMLSYKVVTENNETVYVFDKRNLKKEH